MLYFYQVYSFEIHRTNLKYFNEILHFLKYEDINLKDIDTVENKLKSKMIL